METLSEILIRCSEAELPRYGNKLDHVEDINGLPAYLSYPWNSLGKNTRVDSHSFLQWIFLA